MTRRRKRILASAVVLTGMAGWYLWRSPLTLVSRDRYVGWTREAIIERFGEPEGEWEGHFGLPDANWAAKYDPCTTMTYKKWGGTLYISVYQHNGQRVCFSSDWLAPGSVY